jgi:8-oxo-dGTP pyrophosphatase MutT (NUDIX family)
MEADESFLVQRRQRRQEDRSVTVSVLGRSCAAALSAQRDAGGPRGLVGCAVTWPVPCGDLAGSVRSPTAAPVEADLDTGDSAGAAFGPDLRFDLAGKRFAFRVAAVITRGEHFLMVSNPVDDYLYTVGGAVRFGETAVAALVREVEEETGVAVAAAVLGAVAESFFVDRGAACHEICWYYRVSLAPGKEPAAGSANMFGDPEALVWILRTELGGGRTVYPPFLFALADCEGVRHFVTDGDVVVQNRPPASN